VFQQHALIELAFDDVRLGPDRRSTPEIVVGAS
jgi:hypothetical protein